MSMCFLRAAASAALAVAAITAPASDAHATVNRLSLFVSGDLRNSSNVEGRTFVGGNLTGPASDYATRLMPGEFDALAVGGNINVGAVNIQAGNLRVAGSVSGAVNFNGGGRRIDDPTVPAAGALLAAEIAATSTFLKSLAPNSTLDLPSGQPGPAVFRAQPQGPDNVAVFNIRASDLFSSSLIQSIDITGLGTGSAIINVLGAAVNFNSGNFVGAFVSDSVRARVLWNFHEATSMTFDRAFSGAILAPGAHLTFRSVLSGSVAVKSMDAQSEVHLPLYTGYVPSPGTSAILGLAMIAASRRRRV